MTANHPIQLIAIVSDTHSVLDPRIAEIIVNSDLVIHAGDIGDSKIFDAMCPRSGRVIAVRGNNDHPILWPSSQADRLASIPLQAEITLADGIIAVEHGDRHHAITPDHDSLRKAHPRARVIIYGHTHRMTIDDTSEPWVVNPGAAGDTRTRGGPSCLLLHVATHQWKIEAVKFAETKTTEESGCRSMAGYR